MVLAIFQINILWSIHIEKIGQMRGKVLLVNSLICHFEG